MYGKIITLDEWNQVETAAKLGQITPVFVDLMYEGMEQVKLGDFRRAVIDLAMSCESFMRAQVNQHVSASVNHQIADYINKARAWQLIDQLFPSILSKERQLLFKDIQEVLKKLFTDRNTIMHSGHLTNLTQLECKKYVDATQKLVSIP
jgi:hypothetical protein